MDLKTYDAVNHKVTVVDLDIRQYDLICVNEGVGSYLKSRQLLLKTVWGLLSVCRKIDGNALLAFDDIYIE